ncbi:PREDICTED: serine/threonine-protein kinase 19 isoform X2 [Lupinus angustifolius]|uniref:serine/threonine-protein kinase 19 isoform X2 n=1 Tax=Lupinus angustifolius TaxID=3871 RepID=UPI00092F2B4C|nr:PREDICTED: serine/threonine-protein kinase 19 isoform X2 [Lupinus angustifolius]
MENIPESSSSSKGTKRRRDEEESGDGNTASLELDLTFSDTLVALRIMRAQFPHIPKVSVEPFILKSQLYSSVKDRTLVDRELETLRRDKVLRVFKLNTGQDDHAVMFLDDYINQIDRVIKRIEGEKGGENEVFQWFKTHVLDSKLETGIEHQELCSLLSLGGKVKDSHISILINAGIIGRKEIISLLNRQRYKEMMLASLEKKRLRMSSLDMRFHLRDLIGSGHLRTDQTPSGLVIRVSKD